MHRGHAWGGWVRPKRWVSVRSLGACGRGVNPRPQARERQKRTTWTRATATAVQHCWDGRCGSWLVWSDTAVPRPGKIDRSRWKQRARLDTLASAMVMGGSMAKLWTQAQSSATPNTKTSLHNSCKQRCTRDYLHYDALPKAVSQGRAVWAAKMWLVRLKTMVTQTKVHTRTHQRGSFGFWHVNRSLVHIDNFATQRSMRADESPTSCASHNVWSAADSLTCKKGTNICRYISVKEISVSAC